MANTSLRDFVLGLLVISAPSPGMSIDFSQRESSFEPSYASRMRSPIEGWDIPARLAPVCPTNPIRVVVLDDPNFVTDARLALVREACEKWALAAKRRMARRLEFRYWCSRWPEGANILVRFGSRADFEGFLGFTNYLGGGSEMSIAVVDRSGEIDVNRVRRVLVHEVGHALGIWGHSPDASDVMSLDSETSEVSVSDINTLRLAYRQP